MQQYTLNPIARAIGKEPKAFTKADITKYILDEGIHELNFRYTAADGRLKVLNFVIQDAEYLDEVLSSGERVDGSSLFPGLMEAGSSDLYVVPKFSSASWIPSLLSLRSPSSAPIWTRMANLSQLLPTRSCAVLLRPSAK